MKTYRRILTGTLAAAMLFAAIPASHAESSAEIKQRLDALEAEHSTVQAQLEDLQAQENANWDSLEEMIAQKNNIDQQMFLLYTELDNLDEQITEYGQLIAQNQHELDQAQARLEDLNAKNKERIRAMEEGGKISYWSVIFKASSFTDLIDQLSMVREIAAADEKMLRELDEAAKEVERVQQALVAEKEELEASRAEQLEAQKAMEEKRAEADEILVHLNTERMNIEDNHAAAMAENNALLAEIAAEQQAFNERQAWEEEQRRIEEEKRKQEEAEKENQNNGNQGDSSENNSDDEEDDTPAPPPSESGWLQPCDYVYISSPYGWRDSGWHNGVDFAAYRGTPIYASRSGTVTRARSQTTSYGNHVVINHGDGFSSLYAHMDYFVVSNGEYVTQGQVIGYVGSTGNSTGPHLHFTIMYNGEDVNPMEYL